MLLQIGIPQIGKGSLPSSSYIYLDAVLGAALSFAQVVIIAFVVITLIDYLPWELPHTIIEGSKVYKGIGDFNLLSFQISDLLKSTSLRWDQLRS